MVNVNYQKDLERIISSPEMTGERKTLLLHSCCAPCSSYCLVYLRQWFDITCLYFNPNITDEVEYRYRSDELKRLACELNQDPIRIAKDDKGNAVLAEGDSDYLKKCGSIDVIEGKYEPEIFLEMVLANGLEKVPEGGARCFKCFDLRLSEAVRVANEKEFDYVTTSLTISPLKNASVLNETGIRIAGQYENGTMWLPSDFKKKNGYKFSIELSARYDLYRQNFCGCDFSRNDNERYRQ